MRVLATAAVAISIGCLHVPAQSNPSLGKHEAQAEQDDIAAIRAAGKRWAEYYAAGRFADIPDLYTIDTIVMPRGRARIEGREAMRRAIGGLAAGRRVEIEVTEREVRAIGDYGWYLGDFRVTYTPRQPGGVATVEYGRSLIIYRRDADGHWRVHRDIDSPAPDLGMANKIPVQEPPPAMWDPKSRVEAVACDRLTASRYDRTRLAPPVSREQIDIPAAIKQCEADLMRLPGDPRLHFQLGRLYGYAGDKAKTLYHRKAAAAAGNHNAIFLLGYLAWSAGETDEQRCRAAQEMKLAADRGNYSAQLTYASFLLEGKLVRCTDVASRAEAAAHVASARPHVDGFFETRFAEHLATQLEAQERAAQAGTGVAAAAEPMVPTVPAPVSTPGNDAATRAMLVKQMTGVWRGTFRRYDADGALIEALPSEITVLFPTGKDYDYQQTNLLTLGDGTMQRLETFGRWEGPLLRFSSDRVDGHYGALAFDSSGLNSVLFMRFKDASAMTVSEVITLSPDGTRRMRAAQYVIGGKIVRRTFIDEQRVAP